LKLHSQDKRAISLLTIFLMVSHLALSALCCAQGGALTQTVSAGSASYVIICSPSGTTRVPLADYLAGERTGEPLKNTNSIFGCNHCSLFSAVTLAFIALLLSTISWPVRRPANSLVLYARETLRSFAARAPPALLA